MPSPRETALNGVECALSDAVAKVSAAYEICLIDANEDPAKEADCQKIRDRSLSYAKRAYTDTLAAVNQEWPQGS